MSQEASALIEAALNEIVSNHEDSREGDVLQDWVLIAQVANPSEDAGTGYPMFVSNNDIPLHRVVGLLHLGLRSYQSDV